MHMHAALLTMLLSATGSADLRVTDTPIEPDEVPPGDRETQLLYKSLRDGIAELRQRMTDANQLLFEAHYAGLNLDQLAAGASPGEHQRVRELRDRIEPATARAREALPLNGVFRCRQTVQHLEDSMVAEAGTPAAERLPQKIAEAKACDAEVSAALTRVTPALVGLRQALDEVGPEIRERRAVRGSPASAATADGGSAPAQPAASARTSGDR